MKILGDSIYSFRIINLLAMLIIYCSICRTTKLIFKNSVVTALTEILLMLFYPTVIYTAYHYGTLWAVAFTSLGLFATVSLCETGKRWYAALIIVTFPLGILMHQSAAIGLVAAICYLLFNSEKGILVSRSKCFLCSGNLYCIYGIDCSYSQWRTRESGRFLY